MRYPEWMTEQDIMEFEHDMNRFTDWFEQGSLLPVNAECQIVANEQRLAEQEEYVAWMRQRPAT